VYVVFHLMAAWHVHVALSPPALAVLAGMTAVVLYGKWQMLMRTASWHVRLARHAEMCSTLYGTCHHAVRRVQHTRPAYAAFSAVSSANCARSSAMPAGLSSVLGDSTAVPGEIAPQWEVYG
jgi:hypothetical protein